jgi:hypothetical protein
MHCPCSKSEAGYEAFRTWKTMYSSVISDQNSQDSACKCLTIKVKKAMAARSVSRRPLA